MESILMTQLERDSIQLIEMLEHFAQESGVPFTEQEQGWLRLEHSGDLPPVLGSFNDHERFEAHVRQSVTDGYSHLKSEAPEQAQRFRELVSHLHATSYAAQLVEPVIGNISGEPIARDRG